MQKLGMRTVYTPQIVLCFFIYLTIAHRSFHAQLNICFAIEGVLYNLNMIVFVFELFNRSLIIPILQLNFEGLSRSEMQKAGLIFGLVTCKAFYVCANLWAVHVQSCRAFATSTVCSLCKHIYVKFRSVYEHILGISVDA